MSFKHLNLIPPLERALEKEGYVEPTPIQEKAIPDLLQGRDLIGIAQTGTGKTAAFVLPILQQLTEKYPRVARVLVLAPTRELAAQIGHSFTLYGAFLKFKHTVIFGGVSQGAQVNALHKGVDIIVATPGRLLDLMQQRHVNLKDIEFLVLDEADRMLDMGFINDIKKILYKMPEKRQTLFFSATMSPEINALARNLLKDPVHVAVMPSSTTVESVEQRVFFVDKSDKERLLLELLQQEHLTRVLVFTSMKHRANRVAVYLNNNKVFADAIHGNKSQNARTQALHDFKTGKIKVLVATDIAARGIDIDNISHVINFELPNVPETYVHRIGRTARAGAAGTAYSFCCAEEREFLRDIERLIRKKIDVMDHELHSEHAMSAAGSSARPPPRQHGNWQRNRNRSPKPGSRHGGNRFGGGSRDGGSRPSHGFSSDRPSHGGGSRPSHGGGDSRPSGSGGDRPSYSGGSRPSHGFSDRPSHGGGSRPSHGFSRDRPSYSGGSRDGGSRPSHGGGDSRPSGSGGDRPRNSGGHKHGGNRFGSGGPRAGSSGGRKPGFRRR